MTRDFAQRLAASRGFLTAEDVETIQGLVRGVAWSGPPNDLSLHVVDLGAGSGTTALAVLDEEITARILTIDIDAANLEWARRAVFNAYPTAAWNALLMDAGEAGLHGGGPEHVDLLLHDASHERQHVEADLRAWLPRLAPGAIIWVHDYAPPPAAWGQPDSPGVREAIGALVAEGLIEGAAAPGLGWVGHAR